MYNFYQPAVRNLHNVLQKPQKNPIQSHKVLDMIQSSMHSIRTTDGARRIEFQGKRTLLERNFVLKWRMTPGHTQGVSSGQEKTRGDSSELSSKEPVGRREETDGRKGEGSTVSRRQTGKKSKE